MNTDINLYGFCLHLFEELRFFKPVRILRMSLPSLVLNLIVLLYALICCSALLNGLYTGAIQVHFYYYYYYYYYCRRSASAAT